MLGSDFDLREFLNFNVISFGGDLEQEEIKKKTTLLAFLIVSFSIAAVSQPGLTDPGHSAQVSQDFLLSEIISFSPLKL